MKKFIIVIICLYLITYIRGLRNDNESLMMDNQVIEIQNIILQANDLSLLQSPKPIQAMIKIIKDNQKCSCALCSPLKRALMYRITCTAQHVHLYSSFFALFIIECEICSKGTQN